MAGDWIKMETCLPQKPEILAISAKTGMHPDMIVGKCFRLWAWFDQHTENGHAKGVTLVTLGYALGNGDDTTKFTEAMSQVNWLIENDDAVTLPNFEKHNGASAKKRLEDAKRQKKHRLTKSHDSNEKCHAENVTSALPRIREEKIRDISITNVIDKKRTKFDPVSHLVSLGVDEQVATDYCLQRKKKPTLTAIEGIAAQAAKADMSIEKALRICCSRGWEGFKADWVKDKPVNGQVRPMTASEKFYEAINGTSINEVSNGRVIDVTPRLG